MLYQVNAILSVMGAAGMKAEEAFKGLPDFGRSARLLQPMVNAVASWLDEAHSHFGGDVAVAESTAVAR